MTRGNSEGDGTQGGAVAVGIEQNIMLMNLPANKKNVSRVSCSKKKF